MKSQELEVKFYLTDVAGMQARLQACGANLIKPRVLETNLRYDTPSGDLTRNSQVLRLRQDASARLTYKGPGSDQGGVRARQELEFTVSDFEAARAFLEALGFTISLAYEKFRTTYELDDVEIVLDELPYGNFIEAEGLDPESIQAVSRKLGLDWETRILDSYVMLFERVKLALGLSFRDLSFENFNQLQVQPDSLGVYPADLDLEANGNRVV